MSTPPKRSTHEMIRLSWGDYALIEGVVYEEVGYSPTNDRAWSLRAVLPDSVPARRELAQGSPHERSISAHATYRDARLDDLIFYGDDTAGFTLWTDRKDDYRSWPEGILRRYSGGHHNGDNYWEGRIALSELEDYHDGIPDEWRPYLPDGTAHFRDEPKDIL